MAAGRSGRRIAVGAIAGLALVGGYAVYAQAIVTRSSTVAVPTGASKTTSATCPKGKRLSALGFETTTDNQIGVIINKLDPLRRANAAGATNLSDFDGSLTAHAYCKRPPRKRKLRKLTRVSKTVTLAADTSGSVTATCPKGTSVRFGGMKAEIVDGPPGPPPYPPTVIVNAMERPSPREWKVFAFNDSGTGGGAGDLTAIARCGKGKTLTTASSSATAPDVLNGVTAIASCPGKKKLVFGGFSDTGDVGDAIYPQALERLSGKQWRASTFSFGTADVTAIAYCA